MLRHTLLRADRVSEREHQCIVIAESHREEALPQLDDRWEPGIICQPQNRDTFAGIFLPLTHVYARDSHATVAIFPSDHFIYPETRFIEIMAHAVQAIENLPGNVLLLGAEAEDLELEYGWIWPGMPVWRSGMQSILEVKHFLEKPSYSNAQIARASGGLWNTLIVVSKADTLWQLGWRYFPDIMKHFDRLLYSIGTARESDELRAIYEVMPSRNFSSDFITQAVEWVGVLPMRQVLWSDWGRKERILKTLEQIGKLPNFPTMLAALGRNKTGVIDCPASAAG
jgi:mannose-1-phosphate guanylyltransferase